MIKKNYCAIQLFTPLSPKTKKVNSVTYQRKIEIMFKNEMKYIISIFCLMSFVVLKPHIN